MAIHCEYSVLGLANTIWNSPTEAGRPPGGISAVSVPNTEYVVITKETWTRKMTMISGSINGSYLPDAAPKAELAPYFLLGNSPSHVHLLWHIAEVYIQSCSGALAQTTSFWNLFSHYPPTSFSRQLPSKPLHLQGCQLWYDMCKPTFYMRKLPFLTFFFFCYLVIHWLYNLCMSAISMEPCKTRISKSLEYISSNPYAFMVILIRLRSNSLNVRHYFLLLH